MGVLRIVPDLRDSGRSAGARGVPRDARGPAWWLALLVCKPLLLLGRRADWRGTERLPGSGGAVLAANHVSQADPLFLGEMILAQGRTPRFMAKASLFQGRAVGWWFRSAGHVPGGMNSTASSRLWRPIWPRRRLPRTLAGPPWKNCPRDWNANSNSRTAVRADRVAMAAEAADVGRAVVGVVRIATGARVAGAVPVRAGRVP